MGVRGLRTYVNNNPELLQDYHLHDTRLIIDGGNVCHLLYADSRIPFCHGGEYMEYADALREFVKALQSCHVIPYVVFDGCNENNDRRTELSLSRGNDRLRKALFQNDDGESVLPILAHHTFRKVLDECGIRHATCHMEADREIAALANAWNCPVLSNDSDFFVYPLKRGVVAFDTLKLEIKRSKGGSTPKKYLSAKRYKLDHLRRQYPGMDPERMALFATLQGNDQVDKSKFYPLYNNATIFRTTEFLRGSERSRRNMTTLLTYLSSQKRLNDAISYLISFIPGNERDYVSKEIGSSIKKYTQLSNESLFNVTAGILGAGPVVTPVCDVCTWQGVPIADSLLTALRSSKLSAQPLNAVINRVVFLPCQVEDVSQASSHCCAQEIRAATYGIVLTPQSDKRPSRSNAKLVEYERSGCLIVPKDLEISFIMPDGSSVPSLQDIASMTEEERKETFDKGLGMQYECEPGLGDLHFLLSVIAAWIRRAQPKLLYVYALWLCVLKINVITPMTKSKSTFGTAHSSSPSADTSGAGEKVPLRDVPKRLSRNATALGKAIGDLESLETLKGLCSGKACDFAERSLTVFEETLHSTTLDRTHVHAFSQFQAIYKAALDFNAVLNEPYRPTCASLIFQGSFLYNVSVELNERPQPLCAVTDMLGENSILASWFQRSVAYIKELGGV